MMFHHRCVTSGCSSLRGVGSGCKKMLNMDQEEMISSILMQPVLPPGSPTHILERQKQVQQAAAIAFKSICSGGRA
eukprot:3244010-Amphidinium_carterae.1